MPEAVNGTEIRRPSPVPDAPVPDCDDGCRNTDAGGVGQLWSGVVDSIRVSMLSYDLGPPTPTHLPVPFGSPPLCHSTHRGLHSPAGRVALNQTRAQKLWYM